MWVFDCLFLVKKKRYKAHLSADSSEFICLPIACPLTIQKHFSSENQWISSAMNEINCLEIAGKKQIIHFGVT